MVRPTDTELLNWLQDQTNKQTASGRVLFSWPKSKAIQLGWALFESSHEEALPNVRDAIYLAMEKEKHEKTTT